MSQLEILGAIVTCLLGVFGIVVRWLLKTVDNALAIEGELRRVRASIDENTATVVAFRVEIYGQILDLAQQVMAGDPGITQSRKIEKVVANAATMLAEIEAERALLAKLRCRDSK